jgi:PAS domain S-box-containing protein
MRRQSEEFYRTALDALQEGVYIRGRDGVIVAANKSSEGILGIATSQIIGRMSLVPELAFYTEAGAPIELADSPGMVVLRDGGEHRLVSRVVRPDGTERWIGMAARAVMADGDLRPLASVVSFSDITQSYLAEKALKESEARYRATIETLGDAVVVRSPDMVIVGCNRAAETLFGMPREKIIGRSSLAPPLRLIREDGSTLPREQAAVWRAVSERRAQREEVYGIVREDGSAVWVMASATPAFRPGEDAPFAVVGSYRDITAGRETEARLQQAQDANQILLTAMQQSQDAIFTKDMDACITSWNAGAERIFGFTAAEAIGRPLRALQMRHVSDARYQAVLDRMRNGRSAAFESDQLTKSGRLITAWIVAGPLLDAEGRQVGEITTIRDITELREAQRAVETSNRELERRVAQRTAELEAAVGELQSFSYSVSHDLRAPLRAIDGFSQILMDAHSASLGEEGAGYLARVRTQVSRMTQLIDDLLVLARVTQTGIARADVDISALANAILEEFAESDRQRRVEWRVEPGLRAQVDPGLARILLQNLLGNAWKFTARRALAQISVDKAESARGRAMFVRDNGAGFDMQYAGKLFGAFQRMHGEREFPGTGIGLATVKRIVMRHGGACWAESAPDQGTTVYFTLP